MQRLYGGWSGRGDGTEFFFFDRWGGLLHRADTGWDGGKAGQGVYVYRLVYRDLLSLKTVTEGEVVVR